MTYQCYKMKRNISRNIVVSMKRESLSVAYQCEMCRKHERNMQKHLCVVYEMEVSSASERKCGINVMKPTIWEKQKLKAEAEKKKVWLKRRGLKWNMKRERKLFILCEEKKWREEYENMLKFYHQKKYRESNEMTVYSICEETISNTMKMQKSSEMTQRSRSIMENGYLQCMKSESYKSRASCLILCLSEAPSYDATISFAMQPAVRQQSPANSAAASVASQQWRKRWRRWLARRRSGAGHLAAARRRTGGVSAAAA